MINQITRVYNNIYISDWDSSNNIPLINETKIKAVLTVVNMPKPNDILEYYKQNDIDYMHIYVSDYPDQDINRFFSPSYDFIKKHIDKNENVLVHCHAGMSRSVIIVMNYIIRVLYETKTIIDVYPDPMTMINNVLKHIRMTRYIANPNEGFIKQLFNRINNEYIKYPIHDNKIYLAGSYEAKEENIDKNNLNIINHNKNMCDKSYINSAGKSANIICLSDEDFDNNGNLINFKDVSGIIFFNASWCGHCTTTKPEIIKFSESLGNNPKLRIFSVDGTKNQKLMARIDPSEWNYQVKGYPTIVGYHNGTFYSEYAPDPENMKSFRKAEDLADYANGLGTANVEDE
jgi:protein-tyrosine phosphatase